MLSNQENYFFRIQLLNIRKYQHQNTQMLANFINSTPIDLNTVSIYNRRQSFKSFRFEVISDVLFTIYAPGMYGKTLLP